MQSPKQTTLGEMHLLAQEDIFRFTAERIEAAVKEGRNRSIALTGGSTPKAFYAWAAREQPFSASTLRQARWYTSDERTVPLSSEESNFGVAERGMLDPLGVPSTRRFPWPVMVDPHSAANAFNMRWNDRFGGDECWDLCLVGMGDDGHMLSLFPDSPMLKAPIIDNFVCVDVPGKGWRLTTTLAGLSRCREILVTVTGKNKAERLKAVIEGPDGQYPIQALREDADRVTWLVDADAASLLR